MRQPRWTAATILVLTIGWLGGACVSKPPSGRQASEISCGTSASCTERLGEGYLCSEAGICVEKEAQCPETCGEFCPAALDCTLPAGCENPGCRCPEAVCEAE